MTEHVTVSPFEPQHVDDDVRALASPDVLARWSALDRTVATPAIIQVDDATGCVSAALVSARPGASYVKIVDVVGDIEIGAAAVTTIAQDRAVAAVKWEGWTVDDAQAERLGFTRLRAPLALAVDDEQPPHGYVRWLAGGEPREPAYYRQSTDFSCGAVTALMGQSLLGARDAPTFDRADELTLWRDATNFNACEPFGLAVAVQRAWPATRVGVTVDVDRAVLVDHLPEAEREWRTVLQHASRTQALELGVRVDRERLSIAEVRGALRSGECVLLLISLETMQGFAVPHWVLAHSVLADVVVIEDPWFNPATGDTWVDAHLLPIAAASLDAMSQIERDGFRGAVRLPPPH
jgi:hypothetical protein